MGLRGGPRGPLAQIVKILRSVPPFLLPLFCQLLRRCIHPRCPASQLWSLFLGGSCGARPCGALWVSGARGLEPRAHSFACILGKSVALPVVAAHSSLSSLTGSTLPLCSCPASLSHSRLPGPLLEYKLRTNAEVAPHCYISCTQNNAGA